MVKAQGIRSQDQELSNPTLIQMCDLTLQTDSSITYGTTLNSIHLWVYCILVFSRYCLGSKHMISIFDVYFLPEK